MPQSTIVSRERPNGYLLLELRVCYEVARRTFYGEEGAHLLSVDDELRGARSVERSLSKPQVEAISEDLGLPVIEPLPWEREPRWWRAGGGTHRRVAYARHGRRDWIGGKGYVYSEMVSVWNPERGATRAEAGESAGWGERFALMLTPEEFARKTFPPEHLPPMTRRVALQRLTARPGEPSSCRFVKRTTGELRRMHFRYEPGRSRAERHRAMKAKGLLPVWDLRKDAPRTINLDGVRTVGT